MKIINLDKLEVKEFYLGKHKYKYKFDNNDKKYFIESILELDENNDNKNQLIEIFKNILKKQNLFLDIRNNDIVGLFNFFKATLL